ncbi:response regulator [Phenylobacterium sp.]|jgi:two-component system response regulator MprA|uniref:response regulator n=1 Tax=Phenylobacterium sp. TaxID=1871053 RepID=UPI002F93AB70
MSESLSASSPAALRGLVVDDNQGHRQALGAILTALGIEAETAEDGLEAFEKLQIRAYDIVLMDISMPRMDGLTALRNFRSWETDHAIVRTPVVMVTSHDSLDDRLASIGAGADQHIGKPVGLAPMLAALEQVLNA